MTLINKILSLHQAKQNNMKTYYFIFKGEEFTINAAGYSEAWLKALVHIGLTVYSSAPDDLKCMPFLTRE